MFFFSGLMMLLNVKTEFQNALIYSYCVSRRLGSHWRSSFRSLVCVHGNEVLLPKVTQVEELNLEPRSALFYLSVVFINSSDSLLLYTSFMSNT